MDKKTDIRWKQRFENFKNALAVMKRGIELRNERELTELERGGLIQAFEFTQELSWKVLKDFIDEKGSSEKIYGSKDAIRQALNRGLIENGEIWMKMIEARNESSHTYDMSDSVELENKIANEFMAYFIEMEKKFDELI